MDVFRFFPIYFLSLYLLFILQNKPRLLLHKKRHIYFTLWLCHCAFNTFTSFLFFNKESSLILLWTHLAHMEPSQALLTCFFVLGTLRRTLGLTAWTPWGLSGHMSRDDLGACPTFLANPVASGSRQPSFVRGCIVRKPMVWYVSSGTILSASGHHPWKSPLLL